MKIIRNQDIIEIGGEELFEILRDAIRERHGRELDQIIWTNVQDHHQIGRGPAKIIHLNATLKDKS